MTVGVDMVILAVGYWEEVQRTLILDDPVFPVLWRERAVHYDKGQPILLLQKRESGTSAFYMYMP